MTKKLFRFGQIVEILGTESKLDGMQGKITGKSSSGIIDSYIVTFDSPIFVPGRAGDQEQCQSILIPETCLNYPDTILIKNLIKI